MLSEESTAVGRLIAGSIDMHIHFAPDSLMKRRQNARELTKSARELGMRAIVLKSREYNTVPIAKLVDELVPEVSVFGSLTLDSDVGGLNPAAVLTAARMGAKVIWMPTLTAMNSKMKTEKTLGIKLAGPEQSIFDATGRLRPEVGEILRIVKDFDIVLGSGHLSPREVIALVEEANKIGFSKVVITHALQGRLMDKTLSDEELKQVAGSLAFIEHSFWECMAAVAAMSPTQIIDLVKSVGAERCIMTTDFGQDYNPPAPEGMRLFIASMLEHGLEENEVELMVKVNPARLLGLDRG